MNITNLTLTVAPDTNGLCHIDVIANVYINGQLVERTTSFHSSINELFTEKTREKIRQLLTQ